MVFIKLSTFWKIKGRGREIIHWTCLIAKRILWGKKKKSLAVSLASCLPQSIRSARGCASSHRGMATVDAAAFPARRCPLCEHACLGGRTNVECLWRRELRAGHWAAGSDTQGCRSGDAPASCHLVLARRKKNLWVANAQVPFYGWWGEAGSPWKPPVPPNARRLGGLCSLSIPNPPGDQGRGD